MTRRLQFVFRLLLLTSAFASGKERDWVSSDGRRLRAQLLGVEGDRISLRLADGKRYAISLASLSDGDREFIDTWRRGRSPELALPALEWPKQATVDRFRPSEQRRTADGWEFTTPHFSFRSDAQLAPAALQELATVAEATWRWSQSWPIPIPAPEENGRFAAKLFERRADYEAAGCPKDSAGFFRLDPTLEQRGTLFVPIESLGLEQQGQGELRKGWSYEPRVLIHEICHQMTQDSLRLLPLWIQEGLAEWGSLPLYRNGSFFVAKDQVLARLRERWEDFLRRDPGSGTLLGKGETAPASAWLLPLETLWTGGEEIMARGALADKQRFYFNSLLFIYYLFQLEGDGHARRFRIYWQAVADAGKYFHTRGKEGRLPEGTTRSWENVRPSLISILTEGKTPSAWQDDMTRKFSSVGLRLADPKRN